MPVLVNPGQMALTPIPAGRSSARRHSLSIRTAALVAQYAGSAVAGAQAAQDAMLTRCPPVPRSVICAPNSRQPRATPSRLTPTIASQSASVWSRNGPTIAMPALLTTTSGTPTSARTQPANCSISAALATSTLAASPLAPCDSMTAQVRRAESRSMSAATTCAPLAAKPSATARPIPRPAPVTTTRLIGEHASSHGKRRYRFAVPAHNGANPSGGENLAQPASARSVVRSRDPPGRRHVTRPAGCRRRLAVRLDRARRAAEGPAGRRPRAGHQGRDRDLLEYRDGQAYRARVTAARRNGHQLGARCPATSRP